MRHSAPSPASQLRGEAHAQPRWDIFCRVIDNLGDIGVCWRLARQLATEHGLSVRLWVDEPRALAPLLPGFAPEQPKQAIAGVQVCHWTEPLAFEQVADVVIESFACNPPSAYLDAMAARARPPCWINLEYLSAEAWVSGVHGAASPHPTLPLVKFFFFPGFVAGTGGLLRENGLLAQRNDFLAKGGRERFLATLGEFVASDTLVISLFCYDTAPLAPLLAAWMAASSPLLCLVPPGKPLAAVQACLGGNGPWQLGQARIVPIPFLPQADYDTLLWTCDCNFVRGEDSFVRAQWASKPFIWHIYPQEDGAHLEKLDAFLQQYCPGLAQEDAQDLRRFWASWNGDGADLTATWPRLAAALPRLRAHGEGWCQQCSGQEDLASSLVKFCGSRV